MTTEIRWRNDSKTTLELNVKAKPKWHTLLRMNLARLAGQEIILGDTATVLLFVLGVTILSVEVLAGLIFAVISPLVNLFFL